MNGIAEKDIFDTKTEDGAAVSVLTDQKHSPEIGYGVRIFVCAAVAAVCAALSVYLPILPDGTYDALIVSARSYASEFAFDGTLSGFADAVSSLSSDELYLTLFAALCPTIIFRKRLIYASVLLRTYFLTLGLGLVLSADVGTYPAAAVLASSVASLSSFIYVSYASLRFGDLIHAPDGCGLFSAAVNFILKILSALGCCIIAEMLILLPSAFI